MFRCAKGPNQQRNSRSDYCQNQVELDDPVPVRRVRKEPKLSLQWGTLYFSPLFCIVHPRTRDSHGNRSGLGFPFPFPLFPRILGTEMELTTQAIFPLFPENYREYYVGDEHETVHRGFIPIILLRMIWPSLPKDSFLYDFLSQNF